MKKCLNLNYKETARLVAALSFFTAASARITQASLTMTCRSGGGNSDVIARVFAEQIGRRSATSIGYWRRRGSTR